MTQLATIQPSSVQQVGSINEQHASVLALITKGDLNGLSNEQILQVYIARCDALGVDARTQPFDVLTFQGKKTLYPNARLAEQLISQYNLSVEKTKEETTAEGIRLVEVKVSNGQRSVTASAALNVKGLQADALANAWMKTETKATRRGVLRFCGLGAMADAPVDFAETTYSVRESINVDDLQEVVDDGEAARKDALRYLHAAGKDAGLSHDDIRSYAQEHYPIDSLTELGATELTTLADTLKANAMPPVEDVVVHDDTLPVAPEPEPAGDRVTIADVMDAYKAAHRESPEWADDIQKVESIEDLQHLRDAMKAAGVTGKDFPMLLRWYTAKQNRLKLAQANVA